MQRVITMWRRWNQPLSASDRRHSVLKNAFKTANQAMEVLTFSQVKPAPAPRGKLGWAYSMCERVRPALQAIDKYLKTRTKEMGTWNKQRVTSFLSANVFKDCDDMRYAKDTTTCVYMLIPPIFRHRAQVPSTWSIRDRQAIIKQWKKAVDTTLTKLMAEGRADRPDWDVVFKPKVAAVQGAAAAPAAAPPAPVVIVPSPPKSKNGTNKRASAEVSTMESETQTDDAAQKTLERIQGLAGRAQKKARMVVRIELKVARLRENQEERTCTREAAHQEYLRAHEETVREEQEQGAREMEALQQTLFDAYTQKDEAVEALVMAGCV